MSAENNGKLIALVGLAGCGKSTCARWLKANGVDNVFIEAEDVWRSGTPSPYETSNLTAFMGMRAERISLLFEANQRKQQGHIAFVDSYFDKITGLYIENDGMEWLLPKNDFYRDEIIAIAKKDYEYLPDADVVVMLNVQETGWTSKILTRGRDSDKFLVKNKYHNVQKMIRDALKQWSGEHQKTLIEYDQQYLDMTTVGREILSLFRQPFHHIQKIGGTHRRQYYLITLNPPQKNL